MNPISGYVGLRRQIGRENCVKKGYDSVTSYLISTAWILSRKHVLYWTRFQASCTPNDWQGLDRQREHSGSIQASIKDRHIFPKFTDLPSDVRKRLQATNHNLKEKIPYVKNNLTFLNNEIRPGTRLMVGILKHTRFMKPSINGLWKPRFRKKRNVMARECREFERAFRRDFRKDVLSCTRDRLSRKLRPRSTNSCVVVAQGV